MRRWNELCTQVNMYAMLESHADREAYLKSLMETLTNRLLAKLHQEVLTST
jgi:hypothetical protein